MDEDYSNRLNKPTYIAIIAVLFSISAPKVGVAGVLELTTPNKSLVFHENVHYLIDDEDEYTVDEIIKNTELANETYKYKKQNLDFFDGTIWNVFEIKNSTNTFQTYFLEAFEPSLNVGTLYQYDESGVIKSQVAGNHVKIEDRPLNYRSPTYVIRISPGQTAKFIYKAENGGDIIHSYFKLWSFDDFGKHIYQEQFFLGGYYCIITLISIVFIFFFIFIIKDVTFTTYAFYVLSFFWFQFTFDGFTSQFFTSNEWFIQKLICVAGGLSLHFALRYTSKVLELKKRTPKLSRFIRLLIITIFIVLGVSVTFNGEILRISLILINFFTLLSVVTILFSIFYCKYKGYHVDTFFALAFIVAISFVMIFILKNFSLLDSNTFTNNALKFGSFFEIIFLSISTVNRYKNLQLEKDEAQKNALRSLRELNNYKDELNQQLESEVAQRTKLIELQKEEIEAKNTNLTDSIQYAKRIQEAVLTPVKKIHELLPNSFVLLLPKGIVSGDFYWADKVDDKTLFSVIDCTGHSVPGAFMSMLANSYLSQAIKNHIDKPSKILNYLSEENKKTLQQEQGFSIIDGVSISLCSIKGNILEFAGANQKLIIIRGGEIIEFKGNRSPIGYYTKTRDFENHEIKLKKDDMIYLFSDGVLDQFGGKFNKKLGIQNFSAFLAEISTESESNQENLINGYINHWRGKNDQTDDICVLGMRYC